jgi:iron complex transport system permease protein
MLTKMYLILSFFLVLVLFFYSLSIGTFSMNPLDVFSKAGGGGPEGVAAKLRLARALTALAVGAALAVSGAALQSALRNPLASPFTLGIPQAAAVGVAVAMLIMGVGTIQRGLISINNPYFVVAMAFLAALSNAFLVLFLAAAAGLSLASIILAMIAVSSLYQALLALLQYLFLNDIQTAAVVFWTFGDVGRPTLVESYILMVVAIAAFVFFWFLSFSYNLLAVGDEVAKSSGVDPKRLRFITLVASSFFTAVLVSFTGVIGFVGLAAPHIARLIIGGNYRILLPAAALTGAWLLLGADIVGRLVKPPVIIPVGITMSFIGVAVILALLLRLRRYGEY